MFSDHLVLQGKNGVKWLNQEGPYAVIVNKMLYAWGKAGKFTVVNVSEAWVDSVYRSLDEAVVAARQLYKQ